MRDRNPFEEIEELLERMSSGLEEGADWPVGGGRAVPVDVIDRGEAYEVLADLPGVGEDDVELTLSDGRLRLAADRGADRPTDDGEARYVRRERREDAFDRSVPLPGPVEEGAAEATLADGVLRVTLPKRGAGEESTTIDIE